MFGEPGRRREWPEDVKARIVAESFAPGARVVDVARRHRLLPSQLTMWRRYAREGRLALPEEAPGWARPTEFVPLLLEGSASAVSHRLSARSSRHARQDAFDIWAACTTELSA